MDRRILAARRCQSAVLGAILAIALAGALRGDARAVAGEPWTTDAASAEEDSLLLREPLLSRPYQDSAPPELHLVAQREGPPRSLLQAFMSPPQGGPGSSSISNEALSVSGNPGASNVIVGSGWLGDYLGINRNGWRFAGLNITDANGLSGGLVPGWTADTLTVVDVSIDTDEAWGWQHGLIGGELLYYSGGPVNANAGSVLGYNSLDIGIENRAEIFALWYLHKFADDRLLVRIGKTITTYDFNNVIQATPIGDPAYDISALSSLLFTPLYESPTQYGIIPGYFESATGVVTTLIPIEHTYLKYGFFDGNLANGRHVGTEGPHFNGYYFHIVEIGCDWRVGEHQLPGKFGAGYWAQTGILEASSGEVDGAQGVYLFGSNRLFYEKPGETNEGLSMFCQFAATNTNMVDTHRYFGFGLTYFGLLPGRDVDSAGWGIAYGKMDDDPLKDLGADEIILSWYYQWAVGPNCYLQPNISYIPNPAAQPDIPSSLPVTLRAILLF